MPCSNKKILLTGATGLIGKEVIKPLLDLNFEVSATTRNEINCDCGVNWIQCNLFDENSVKKIFEQVKPTHLLNLAWVTTGDYLTSNINFDFVQTGLNLLKYFKKNGGTRAIFAGTCHEFEFNNELLKENGITNPQNVYAKCKNALRLLAEAFCEQNKIEFGWGRIFYVYGHGEDEKRLTPYIIKSLLDNKELIIHNGNLMRDYMYSKDIAGAFVKFLDSNVCGCINICTGNEISLGNYAMAIGKQLQKEHLLIIRQEKTSQAAFIVGDNTTLLHDVQYKMKYTFNDAIIKILKDSNAYTTNARSD